jgi:hypothetical protein
MAQRTRRWRRHPLFISLVSLLAGGAIVLGLMPAFAGVTAGVTPKVAFVARDDVPFDSLAVGPVAAHFGGIVVITGTHAPLHQSARDALLAFDPDLVVVAGGEAAIGGDVYAQLLTLAAAEGWDLTRVFGESRNETAEALAGLLATYEVGQQLVAGPNPVPGNFDVGGQLREQGTEVDLRGMFNFSTHYQEHIQNDATMWTDLPSTTLGLVIPPGQSGYIRVDFSGESVCSGSPPPDDWCQLRILLDGEELEPAISDDFAFDSGGTEGWKSLATSRVSGLLSAGSYEVQVQFSVTDNSLTFRLDDYITFAEVHLI